MNHRQSHLANLGLVRNPFPPTPDAGCYFSTPHLEEQMVELAHCVLSRKGFCLLTAEVGMGKSTLVRRLISDLAPKGVVSALVFNTFLQGPELLVAVLQDFGLQSAGSMSADIAEFNDFLLRNHQEGKTCLLIIDDAQNLSQDSLELVRLLCNLETDQEKLLQILLTGQPELEKTLSQHNLRQLRSRVVKHARLHGLSSVEIADYVKFRFDSAGSNGSLVLQAGACRTLWQETQGVPRHIHLILDRCLYGLAAKDGNVIDPSLIQLAITDTRLELHGTMPLVPTSKVPIFRLGLPGLRWATGLGVLLVGLVWLGISPAQIHETLNRVLGSERGSPLALLAAQPHSRPSGGDRLSVLLPEATESQCKSRTPLSEGRVRLSQPLPERTLQLLGDRLFRLDDVCMDRREGQTWLTWGAGEAGYDLAQRRIAARLQIALTAYGSLLSQEVDGVWGNKSQQALKQFQSGIGLVPTGSIDALSGLLLERFYVQEQ